MSCTISDNMEDIDVNRTEETKDGWMFGVTVGDSEYEDEVNKIG